MPLRSSRFRKKSSNSLPLVLSTSCMYAAGMRRGQWGPGSQPDRPAKTNLCLDSIVTLLKSELLQILRRTCGRCRVACCRLCHTCGQRCLTSAKQSSHASAGLLRRRALTAYPGRRRGVWRQKPAAGKLQKARVRKGLSTKQRSRVECKLQRFKLAVLKQQQHPLQSLGWRFNQIGRERPSGPCRGSSRQKGR